jgi:hypothetical protein
MKFEKLFSPFASECFLLRGFLAAILEGFASFASVLQPLAWGDVTITLEIEAYLPKMTMQKLHN